MYVLNLTPQSPPPPFRFCTRTRAARPLDARSSYKLRGLPRRQLPPFPLGGQLAAANSSGN